MGYVYRPPGYQRTKLERTLEAIELVAWGCLGVPACLVFFWLWVVVPYLK